MTFDAGTWWLITLVVTVIIGLVGYLFGRTVFAPVSYTHLDVYKRQALERVILRLQECGAPAEFFVGKSDDEIMEGLATLLKMTMEAVNLARKIRRKDR